MGCSVQFNKYFEIQDVLILDYFVVNDLILVLFIYFLMRKTYVS